MQRIRDITSGAPAMTAPAGGGSDGGTLFVKKLRRHREQMDMNTAHRYAVYSCLRAARQYIKLQHAEPRLLHWFTDAGLDGCHTAGPDAVDPRLSISADIWTVA